MATMNLQYKMDTPDAKVLVWQTGETWKYSVHSSEGRLITQDWATSKQNAQRLAGYAYKEFKRVLGKRRFRWIPVSEEVS